MSARADRNRKTTTRSVILFLLIIMTSALIFRSWFASNVMPPPGRMQGETTQAYRYSRMISNGEAIPAIDSLVMHPAGMRTGENSIFEEYIAGALHSLTGGDFDGFMRLFCFAFPLLSIPGLYLWMRSTGIPSRTALLGAAVYGVLLPALLRTRGESLYRETVALPLLVWTGWAVDSALAGGRRVFSLLASLLFVAALASWKVTSFVSALLFLYLFIRQCRKGDVPRFFAVAMATAQILSSLFLSHMRHDTAILSAGSVLAVFLLCSSMGIRWKYLAPAGTILAALSAFLFSASSTHVGAVILAKLRFLFSHPSDPLMLSPDARLFWVSGYTSPAPAEILLLFAVPLAVAAFGLRRFFSGTCRRSILYWFLPVSLSGYLFFDRLHVFLAVALVTPIALACRRLPAAPAILLVLALQSVFVAPLAGFIEGIGLDFRDDGSLLGDAELDSLLEWTADKTREDDAFMSFWHLSGLISAYGNRPVVTHTFFENAANRKTIIEFAERTFQPEDSLVSFMRRHDADLYVYQADFILDRSSQGLLYLSGLGEVPDNCAALRMHFAPDTLDSMALVFQGPSMRVFRLRGEPLDYPAQPLFQLRYYHIFGDYDAARAALAWPVAMSMDLAWRGRERRDPQMVSAALLLASGADMSVDDVTGMLQELVMSYFDGTYGIEYLEEDFLVYLHYYGPDPAVRLDLARLLASEGLVESSVAQYGLVLQEDPACTEAIGELELLLNGQERADD